MNHDEYAALVARLEELARTRPTTYRLRVGALAALGYAYVIAVLLVLIATLVLMVWSSLEAHVGILMVKLALPLLALLAAIGRALWVTVPPPEGRALRRDEAPILHAEIDAVRRAANAPRPHHVILNDELNASANQVPRLGIFGWHQNYLSIGLPLLTATTPEQFRAVLAHEFGHLSHAHARFTNWIYRVRGTWKQIQAAIHHRRSRLGNLLVNKFVDWYEPYFRAYSFVLARRHELEADQTSVTVVGGHAAAMAIAAITLRGRYLNEVLWPTVVAQMVDEATPPRAAFSGYVQRLPDGLPLPLASEWLTAELRVESGVDDAHPALKDRLISLGELPRDDAALSAMAEELALPIDPEATAASYYLGALVPSLATELDDRWRAKSATAWSVRHRHLTGAREGLQELTARAAVTPISSDELFRVADWTEDLEGIDAALPIVRALVEQSPTHASGLFMLGRMLLTKHDDAGIPFLERAIEIHPDCAGAASALIANHLQRVGRRQEAIAYRVRADASMAEAAAAVAERRRVETYDKLTTSDLDAAARERLRAQLTKYSQVGRAWIGRKVTHHAPDRPFYVIGIAVSAPWWRFVSEGSRTYLARKLAEELELPPGTLVVVFDRKRRWLKRKLQRMRNSELYRRRR